MDDNLEKIVKKATEETSSQDVVDMFVGEDKLVIGSSSGTALVYRREENGEYKLTQKIEFEGEISRVSMTKDELFIGNNKGVVGIYKIGEDEKYKLAQKIRVEGKVLGIISMGDELMVAHPKPTWIYKKGNKPYELVERVGTIGIYEKKNDPYELILKTGNAMFTVFRKGKEGLYEEELALEAVNSVKRVAIQNGKITTVKNDGTVREYKRPNHKD